MMRTRNFRVRNDVVVRGSVAKSQKRKEACVGSVLNGRRMDNVRKEAHEVSIMTLH